MNRYFLLIMAFGWMTVMSLAVSCKKENVTDIPYDPSKPIVLESYSPNQGGVGSQLIIRGSNFGNDISRIKVYLDNDEDKPARVISARGNRIYAIIPARAGSGKVTVEIESEGGDIQIVQSEDEFQYEFRSNLSTLCGGAREEDVDGAFNVAQFVRPARLAFDEGSNTLYVLETDASKCLRVLDLTNETVSTPWRAPGLNNLRTISLSPDCDTLYVGVEGGSSNVSTVYLLRDDGFVRHKTYAPQSGSNASIINPVDGELFINNYWTGEIFRYDRGTGEMISLVECFNDNTDFTFCWSADGRYLYALALGPGSRSIILRMEYDFATKTLGEPNTWVGNGTDGYSDGTGEDALINQPYQMCNAGNGEFFLADTWNHCIRRIVDNAGLATVTTYAGIPQSQGYTEGDPLDAQLRFPTGVAATADGSIVYVADKDNNRIVRISVE